jgi:hypothetical protein
MLAIKMMLLTDPNASRNGIIMIMDSLDMGWDAFSLESEKVYMSAMSSLPVRYPAMVALNPTMFMRTIINIVWPFVPSKLRERLRLTYAEDLEGVVGSSHMPAYMHGPVPTDAASTIAKLKEGFQSWVTPAQLADLLRASS